MPKVALLLSATLTNVTLLTQEGIVHYFFKIKCTNCGCISEDERSLRINTEEPGQNDCLSLLGKCKECERIGNIKLVPGHTAPITELNPNRVRRMVFEYDTLVPTEYSFTGGWMAVTRFGATIRPLDLFGPRGYRNVTDGQVVAITNLQAEFVPLN